MSKPNRRVSLAPGNNAQLPSLDNLRNLRRKSMDAQRLKLIALQENRPKPRVIRSFKYICQLIIFLLRKANSAKFVNRRDEPEFMPYVKAFDDITSVDAPVDEKSDGIVFQKNKFKPNRDLLVLPLRAVKIFRDVTRSDEDVKFVVRCLRVLTRFRDYPESVQEKMVHKMVYQTYEEKRMILREGHRPEGMYFVVAGQALEFTLDYDGNSARPSFVASQGDIFGEAALLQEERRPKTWISQSPIILLYLRDEDYFDIFNMTTSMVRKTSQNDETVEASSRLEEFLKTIRWFETWPLQMLQVNRTKHTFRMFKRGEIIEEHSAESPWLYIIYSGSITLMKKLKKNPAKDLDDERKMFTTGGRRKGMLCLDYTRQIGVHEEWHDRIYLEHQMWMKHDRLRMKLRDRNSKLVALKELVPLEEVTQDGLLRSRGSVRRRNTDAGQEPKPEELVDEKPEQLSIGKRNLQMILDLLGKKQVTALKEPNGDPNGGGGGGGYARETTGSSTSSSSMTEDSRDSSMVARSRTITQIVSSATSHRTDSRMSIVSLNNSTGNLIVNQATIDLPQEETVTIEIETLEPGRIFGAADIVHEDQPDLMLMTKQGAEVFLMDKELFRKNASDELLTDMVKGISPYPSDQQLQYRLQTYTDWEVFRTNVHNDALRQSLPSKLPVLPKIKTK